MTMKYDLMVKVGTYQQDGKTKGQFENVGVLIEGEHGPYILLKKTFNPAGVVFDDSKNVLIALWDKDSDEETPF